MLSTSVAALSFAPTAPIVAPASRTVGVAMETKADLEAMAAKLNPAVGFYDPLGLASPNPASTLPVEASIGFLRHSELKHGRVAMAAFVGYCVQANGIYFPWALTTSGITHADISAAGGPADQWDALPTISKLQIFGFIFFLEMIGESSNVLAMSGEKHYCKGGKPGFYPSLKKAGIPHPIPLDLFDPFGLQSKMSPERKEKALLAEINNGRLAMIGIFGLISASKGLIVPGLDDLGIPPYAGEVMAPFSASDSAWPVVADMLKWTPPY